MSDDSFSIWMLVVLIVLFALAFRFRKALVQSSSLLMAAIILHLAGVDFFRSLFPDMSDIFLFFDMMIIVFCFLAYLLFVPYFIYDMYHLIKKTDRNILKPWYTSFEGIVVTLALAFITP